MGTKILHFDLSAFTDQEYFMTPFFDAYTIKEYGQHEKENATSFTMLARGLPKGYATITTTIDDNSALLGLNVLGVMSLNFKLPLRKVGANNTIYYDTRPFSFDPTTQTDSLHIPLVFLASGWEDDQVVRLCGDDELVPDMSSDLMKLSPHYYVTGIDIKK